MYDQDLYDQITTELRSRSEWESKQASFYQMRFVGVPRSKKPYPNAPDTHYPLIDTMVDKLRPFYLGQIYGQERLATFASNQPQDEAQTSTAEKFLDYTLKQKSNFERTMFTGIDHMLMYGRGPIKTYWNPRTNKLEFSAVRPIYIIVPSWTEELGSADWLVHVMHMSVAQYEANPEFRQDDDFVKSIKGRGINATGDSGDQQEQDKLARQGITYGENSNQIVLWEVYTRDGEDIMVDTVSPVIGFTEEKGKQVRPQFGLPYKHNCFPFADLRYEITDPDFYAPRGVAEILAQDQLMLCKFRNQKLEFMDFHSRPMFSNDGSVPNLGNLSMGPGRLLPNGVAPIAPFTAPFDFKEEMQLQRALAEDRVQVPDLNSSEHLTGPQGSSGNPTATQINAIVAQSSTGNDMRARIFRLQLADIYRQAFCIIADMVPKSERVLEDFSPVPDSVLTQDYRITPSGSADGYSKEKRMARALAYYQNFAQTFAINQSVDLTEMTKWVFENDDPQLAERFVKEPMQAQGDQMQKQASENLLMQDNFAPQVHPNDDDKSHLQAMASWVQDKAKNQQPISPQMAQKLIAHGEQHLMAIKKKKDKQGMMMAQQLAPVANFLKGIVAHAQATQAPSQQQPGPMAAPAQV